MGTANQLSCIYVAILWFAGGLPAVYLSWRKPGAIARSFYFSAPLSLVAVVGDYFAIKDQAWHVPTIFPFRILATVPLENVIWFFLVAYLITIFYEVFFDHMRHKTFGRRLHYLYLMLITAFTTLVAIILFQNNTPSLSYFYFKSSLVLAALPLAAFIFEFPRFLGTLLKITPYFACLFFLNEIVGLHKGYWTFPGNHFIGWISIAGYRFPYEEAMFYIVLFAAVIITYFEIFDDNRLKFKFNR